MKKNATTLYRIYLELSKRFHLGIPPCREFESSPAREDAAALKQVEAWFRQADKQIEVHHLRELLGTYTLAGDTLHSLLAWHMGKEPKSKPDRNKIDFLLVQYLAECLPTNVSAHQLGFEQVAEVLRPVLGEATVPRRVAGLEDCIRDLDRCRTLSDLVDHWILERGHAVKVAAQEKAFDPTTLAAFTHFSFLLRLGCIRVLREDIQALEDNLKELENKGVTEIDVDCASAVFAEKQSIGELRKCCVEWKRYFPEKYSQNQWFADVIQLRADVKRALEASTGKPAGESTLASATKTTAQARTVIADTSSSAQRQTADEARLQVEMERYSREIATQVQSVIGGSMSSVTAVDVAGLRLMLSSGEVDAFQEPYNGADFAIQRAVAVRAVLLSALNNATDLRAAVNLAESAALALEKQITSIKEAGDTETAVNLAACYRSLRKILEKMDRALLSRHSAESLRASQVQAKQQPTRVEHG